MNLKFYINSQQYKTDIIIYQKKNTILGLHKLVQKCKNNKPIIYSDSICAAKKACK